MKKLLLFVLCLGGSTATFAQALPVDKPLAATSEGQPSALLPTAADSAQERARRLNAYQLRRQATAAPRPISTTPPATLPRHIASGEALDAAQLAQRAQIRNQQEQQMITTSLTTKRARRAAAKAAAPTATSENDRLRRSK